MYVKWRSVTSVRIVKERVGLLKVRELHLIKLGQGWNNLTICTVCTDCKTASRSVDVNRIFGVATAKTSTLHMYVYLVLKACARRTSPKTSTLYMCMYTSF